MNKNILWTILLSAFLICVAQPSHGSILIGRITHVEGKVLTYGEDNEDWVEAGSNTPVGAEDGFYTDKGSRAELAFPNDTMLRMGELTEMEVLRIEKEFTEVYIRTGTVRAYSDGLNTVVKVGTAMGYVEIPPQGTADFFVDDRSTEIVPLQEDILFHKTVGADAPEAYELRAGSNSLIISVRHVETGTALADTPWNRWCLDRAMVLKEQAAIRSTHLPSNLQVYSHELEPYGEWEMMKYRGYNYWFWRPVRVNIGWTPFTRGRWNRWHREYVWISAEPWGWCTHHYGNWVNLYGAWRWTPYIHMGVSSPGISLVDLHIRFGPSFRPFWHPGRIAWVSTVNHVGWIPLAPWETYYGCRKWGPRTVVVEYRDRPKSRNYINHYAYRNYSVIVPQKEFRRVSPNTRHDYRELMVTGAKKKTLLKDSRPTYGYHKMAEVKQNGHKGKMNSTATRQRAITKPNAFRSSTPPVSTSRERASTPEKRTALSRKETGDGTTKVTKRRPLASSNPKSGVQKSPQVSTTRQPRKPSTKQEYATPQNPKQTRPKQSPGQSSTFQRAQPIKKNTVPPSSGQSMKSQSSKKPQKLGSQQSGQKRGATGLNTTSERASRGSASTPERRAALSSKGTGDRTTKVTERRPLASSNAKSAVKKPPQVSTARPPRKPSGGKGYSTRQSPKQTRPEQSARQSSTLPRAQLVKKNTVPSKSGSANVSQPSKNQKESFTAPRTQQIKKNTVPSKSGPSIVSQPSKNSQKWASPQSRQKRGATGLNTTPRQRLN